MRLKVAALFGVAFAVAGCAAVSQTIETFGYLHGREAPDTIAILPPPPTPESSRGLADRAIFLQTRILKDTPRWVLAQNDAAQTIPTLMRDFSCAADATLTPDSAPKLNALMSKMSLDVVHAVTAPKDKFQRKRPYLIDEGEICIARSDALARSPDYPSGHATWGWTLGLVLAELAPDRSTQILTRARAYGESRVVCGVHNVSAIEAGRTNASALVAALHGSKAFRADMEAARTEIAALRAANTPKPQACDAEAALTERTPW